MLTYIIRRLLYAIPILIGVNLLTALLFFYINTPDDMARMILGEKNLTPEAVENWKKERGYDLPLFINTEERGLSISNPDGLRPKIRPAPVVRLRQERQEQHRYR